MFYFLLYSFIQANLTVLFDKYLPTLQDGIKKKFKKITPIPVINHIQVLCSYLSALITPANVR